MMTICWEGHRFEYLQDQTTCNEPGCGETSQHMPRRFGPGEKEAMKARYEDNRPIRHAAEVRASYSRGYGDGFEAGILAEEKRVKR